MFFIIVIAVVVLLILLIIGINSNNQNTKQKSNSKTEISFGNAEYQREILSGIKIQNRNDFSRLYNDLADIQRKIDTYSTLINTQKESAIADINSRIVKSQKQINNRWNICQRKEKLL